MTPPLPSGGFDDLVGFRITAADGSRVEGVCPVTPSLLQPAGLVHGGVYCTIVESLGSIGGMYWLREQGRGGPVVGVNNNTHFLRSVREGELRAVGTPVHQGRSQQLWTVEIRDAADRLVSRGDLRVANLDPPPSGGTA